MRTRALPLALGLLGACASPPKPIVDLVVDSNRNGLLDPGDPTEDDAEDVWDGKHGAVFLANLDDDDKKGKADASDDIVNGAADIADLAPIAIRAWPLVSPDATGALALDAASAPNVRLFRVDGPASDPKSYRAVADPKAVPLSNAELKAGVQLALEARDFVTSTKEGAWTGVVQLELTVTDVRTKQVLTDKAKLRVAPLLFQFNTAPTQAVFYTDLQEDSALLVQGMKGAGLDPTGFDLDKMRLDPEPWAQDFFDVGYTSRPGPGGKPIGMKIAIRSAQEDRTAGEVTTRYFLGPDFGATFKHSRDGSTDHGYSMNSFGNWDVIPPYDKGQERYPVGRNLWGAVANDPSESPDADFADFVRAQRVQPEVIIDTSWLVVGHVDEMTAWVRSNTPRGWGLLVARPKLAREMLLALKMKGQGGAKLFSGKTDWEGKPAEVTVDQVLASAKLMAASQESQLHVDDQVAILQKEIGLSDGEITPMPFLYAQEFGAMTAYQPGTVNLLHVDGKVVIPDPFGPVVDGADVFKADLLQRLPALGLQVFFADDWDLLHLGAGEVHCGTNVSRDLSLPWWESAR